ncbi:C40 family peptidase [Streptomyces coffeae]|uniref:C40 family peptidase n=1 Tax=Streptomyces coffeae TaxID=621382 RepID=A0ABS1NRC5_9ACTN|nr:C40 family peptidase [Streptomyces coffeae]MBL1102494.1 C40 family peptidase [Streptomyces coffeae]
MSPVAHIPSHRKPRRAASKGTLRAGVTGGFLTIAVAGAAVPASASESSAAESTIEMPTVSATLANTAAQTADATQQAASEYQLQAQQDQAAAHAKAAAKKAKAEADRKAKEAREAARKAAAKRAAEAKAKAAKASRSAERSTLSTSATNATGNAATVISFLKAQLGKAYVLGTSGPSSYDCSGLTKAAFKQVGIDLPRVSQEQSTVGTQVSLDNLQPGDILYWGSSGSAYHVGVYIGGGKFIGAQNPSTGIVERSLDYDPPTGAVRVL